MPAGSKAEGRVKGRFEGRRAEKQNEFIEQRSSVKGLPTFSSAAGITYGNARLGGVWCETKKPPMCLLFVKVYT